jgi:hypothetical protein
MEFESGRGGEFGFGSAGEKVLKQEWFAGDVEGCYADITESAGFAKPERVSCGEFHVFIDGLEFVGSEWANIGEAFEDMVTGEVDAAGEEQEQEHECEGGGVANEPRGDGDGAGASRSDWCDGIGFGGGVGRSSGRWFAGGAGGWTRFAWRGGFRSDRNHGGPRR